MQSFNTMLLLMVSGHAYALHVTCGTLCTKMCRVAFVFWPYGLYKSYFSAYSKPSIERNVMLLEFYKQVSIGLFYVIIATVFSLKRQCRKLCISENQGSTCGSFRYVKNFPCC